MGCARCTGRRAGRRAGGGAKRQEAPRGIGAHGRLLTGEARGRNPTRSRTISAIIRPAREDGRGAVRCGAVRCGAVRRGAWRARGECVASRVGPSGWNCTLFTPRCDIIVADDYHGSINWRSRAKHCAGCAGRVLAVRGVGRARWLSDIEISTPDNARVQGPRENNADLTSSSAVAWGQRCICMVREC